MMYFEVLRHYAIFQELVVGGGMRLRAAAADQFHQGQHRKWRDVLARRLLPMPSETYLQPFVDMAGSAAQHPLLKAFDASERHQDQLRQRRHPGRRLRRGADPVHQGQPCAPGGSAPAAKTRYDRIKSLPVINQDVTTAADRPGGYRQERGRRSPSLAGLTGGLSMLFTGPPGTEHAIHDDGESVLVKQAIFDAFMSMDANFQSVPPAQCIRVVNFAPASISLRRRSPCPVTGLRFLRGRHAWTRSSGSVRHTPRLHTTSLEMLDYYFSGRLISEWDEHLLQRHRPAGVRQDLSTVCISASSPPTSRRDARYTGGERAMRAQRHRHDHARPQPTAAAAHQVFVERIGAMRPEAATSRSTSRICVSDYSTAHYNGLLYAGNVGDDLLDATELTSPKPPRRSATRAGRTAIWLQA